MAFLKSRVALESVAETENENEENGEGQQNAGETTEPVSNDDGEQATDQTNAENGVVDGGGSTPEAQANADDSQSQSDDLENDAEQAQQAGEEVEIDLDNEEVLAQESQDLCGEINTVLSVANALESMSDFVYASMKSGSYTPVASTFVNTQVNMQLDRLNQKTGALIAMEADADPAAQAGVAAQNRGTIRAFIDRMIKAATDALDTVVKYIRERTDRIFTAMGRMKSRVDALKKHLDKKETTVRALNSPRMMLAIGVNGKITDLATALDGATGVINHFCSEAAYGHFKKLIEKAATKDDKSVAEMSKSLSEIVSSWKKKLPQKLIKEDGWWTTDLLPGNYVFAACLPDSIEKLQDLKTAVKQVPFEAEVDGNIEAIDIAKAKVLVDKIARGLATIEKTRKSPAISEVEKGFSGLVSEAKRMDDRANSGVLRQAFNAVIRLITASASAPSVTFTAGWMRIAANYLDYISSATSFGFVNAASNAAGDKMDAAGKYMDEKTKPARDAVHARIDPLVNSAKERAKPYVDSASAKMQGAKDTVNNTMSGLRSRFSQA